VIEAREALRRLAAARITGIRDDAAGSHGASGRTSDDARASPAWAILDGNGAGVVAVLRTGEVRRLWSRVPRGRWSADLRLAWRLLGADAVALADSADDRAVRRAALRQAYALRQALAAEALVDLGGVGDAVVRRATAERVAAALREAHAQVAPHERPRIAAAVRRALARLAAPMSAALETRLDAALSAATASAASDDGGARRVIDAILPLLDDGTRAASHDAARASAREAPVLEAVLIVRGRADAQAPPAPEAHDAKDC
jgi:hypothetical protein